MGKRSDFERRERDFYPTPREAVAPLLPYLRPATSFIEPCAGDGALVRTLEDSGHSCWLAVDIEPQHPRILRGDAMAVRTNPSLDCFITNPPWDRSALHPIITHLAAQAPTWLLFDADWMHTRQSAEFMPWCRKIVSVGRVKWIPDSKMTGKDNCCWYEFWAGNRNGTHFFGRPT